VKGQYSDSHQNNGAWNLHCKRSASQSSSAEVSKALVICLVVLPFCCAKAQQQEQKLVNRIMEPNMKLENEAQNKKFTADRTSVNKRAHVSTFYLQQKSPGKRYSGTRDYSAAEFDSRSFNQGDQAVSRNLGGKKADTAADPEGTKTSSTRSASDQNKSKASRDYAGNRPYLEKGKSQKSLNRKNKPMTIDEVRELLNKNK
jgi:hypothetical protein